MRNPSYDGTTKSPADISLYSLNSKVQGLPLPKEA